MYRADCGRSATAAWPPTLLSRPCARRGPLDVEQDELFVRMSRDCQARPPRLSDQGGPVVSFQHTLSLIGDRAAARG
jgi:hypothetical protein